MPPITVDDDVQLEIELEHYLTGQSLVKLEAVATFVAIGIGSIAFIVEISQSPLYDKNDAIARLFSLITILLSGTSLALVVLTIPCLSFIYMAKGIEFALPKYSNLSQAQKGEIKEFFARDVHLDLDSDFVTPIKELQRKVFDKDKVMQKFQTAGLYCLVLGLMSAGVVAWQTFVAPLF